MSLTRDVTSVGTATLVSRILAFLRDIWIASILGTTAAADAFFALLQLVNVLRHTLAEGALNTAFVPVWLRVRDENGEMGALRFVRDVLIATILVAGVAAFIGFVFASPLISILMPGFDAERHNAAAVYLSGASPYLLFAAVGAILVAWLCAERRVGAASIGIVAFNAVLLGALALATTWATASGIETPAAIGTLLAHAIALAGLAQVVVTGLALWRLKDWTFSKPGPILNLSQEAISKSDRSKSIWRFFALAAPGLLAAGMPQIKLMAGAMVASSSAASVSWLYYTNRLYELPLALISVIIATALAPRIAASTRTTSVTAIAGDQSHALEIALGISLPAALALSLLSHEIAGGLFQRGAFGASDTVAVTAALAAICIGLPGHALEKVFGAISLAHDDARMPLLAALMGLATAVTGALLLFPTYGHVGVAAAIGASGWVAAILAGAMLMHRGWLRVDRGFGLRLLRIAAATAMMGIALAVLRAFLEIQIGPGLSSAARLAILAVLTSLGLTVYVTALHLLGVMRFHDVMAGLRGRSIQ